MINLYRTKRLFQLILEFKSEFKNWDVILKSMIQGKTLPAIINKDGIKIIPGKGINAIRIYNEIFKNQVYTPEGHSIGSGQTVIDIGANIGIFSLFAYSSGASKVIGFEPHPNNFKKLCENIYVNYHDSFEGYNVGIAVDENTRLLKIEPIDGGHKLVEDIVNGQTIEIKTICLNDFLNQNSLKNIFVKMDCEGAEGEILESLTDETFNKINKLSIEFHNNNSTLQNNEIVSLLESKGYNCIQNWDNSSYYGYIYASRISEPI